MADLTFEAWGVKRHQGDPQHRHMAVILNNAVHHWSLTRLGLHRQHLTEQMRELGLDAGGAPLSITRTVRPVA